jgi:hypothetical protein
VSDSKRSNLGPARSQIQKGEQEWGPPSNPLQSKVEAPNPDWTRWEPIGCHDFDQARTNSVMTYYVFGLHAKVKRFEWLK